MTNSLAKVKAPSLFLMMMEGRSIFELGSFFAASPYFKYAPKGDGHPVLVLPGLAAGDNTTSPIRKFLTECGYNAFAWELGLNYGLREGLLDAMIDRVDEIYEMCGQKLSIVGWSLGGIYARELAKARPKKVRFVISLGSPHSGHPISSNASALYEFVAGHPAEKAPIDSLLYKAPPVPNTSIYTKTDGIVAWQNCHQSRPVSPEKAKVTENICVEASHCGLGFHPTVLFIIADRLAQREGQWKPISSDGYRRLFFSTPDFDEVDLSQ